MSLLTSERASPSRTTPMRWPGTTVTEPSTSPLTGQAASREAPSFALLGLLLLPPLEASTTATTATTIRPATPARIGTSGRRRAGGGGASAAGVVGGAAGGAGGSITVADA